MAVRAAGRARRLPIWFLAGVSLAASLAFLGVRLAGTSDGARIAFYVDAWTSEGARVEPIHPRQGSLVSGDVVRAVDGRPLGSWIDAVLDPTLTRPFGSVHEPVTYGVLRDGASVDVPVTFAGHDVSAILADYWSVLIFTIVFQVVAAFVLWRRPGSSAAVALVVAACGVTGSTLPWLLGLEVSDIVAGWPFLLHALTASGLYMLLWPAGAVHLPLALTAGPAGPGRRVLALAYGLPLGAYGGGLLVSRLGAASPTAWLGTWPILQQFVIVPTILVGMVLGIRAYRSAVPAEKDAIRWAAVGGGTSMVLLLGLLTGPQLLIGRPLIPWTAVGLIALPLPIGIAAGILRYRLFDIEVAVNRALVYGGLTLVVVAVYVVMIAVLSGVLGETRGFAASLLATGGAALAALPVRDVLQRAVNRLMFGDRDEPWRAVRRLGQRLEWTADPASVFPVIVRTVGEALRLPYVALEIDTADGRHVAASFGRPVDEDAGASLSLVHAGRTVGQLRFAPRSGEDALSPGDLGLLEDLARQAGAAVDAASLTRDLLRSRAQLVTAREEERRRLRRDLHDGLGPALAGIAMRSEAAVELVARDPEAARRMLSDLQAEARGALADIRRLVYGLRPPALDELGLVGAIRQHADRLTGAVPRIEIDAPAKIPDLPAAVEVAAYRIAVEGLENAAHHADARSCWVRLRLDGALVVEVDDDGGGIAPDTVSGVGLTSMRERALELGGRCEIGPRRGGGTRVSAWLPLPAAPDALAVPHDRIST
ncbi:MAG TPA: histidine kinase [Candidatus Sulfomarinibacteraceae bacterium]|nr:histidine kinase [Candidatus Sulfomarinibacteraceae bacterium]